MEALLTLSQRRYFNTRSCKTYADKIDVKIKTLNESTEFSVPYEELGTQIVAKKISSFVPFLFMLVPAFMLILLVYFLAVNHPIEREHVAAAVLFGIVASIILIATPKNSLYLSGGRRQIEFYRNKPNDKEVDAFVQTTIETANKYLKQKYGKIDRLLPIEPQLNSILWLKNKNIITETEFDELKTRLVGEENAKNGFGFNV